jgi:sarcosine oxidase subunit alpha
MSRPQPNRLPSGGRIDRTTPLALRFDGVTFEGFAGDTLASALLANGVRLVGRSFKYHRRRGIYTAGPEEPNALVSVRRGPRAEPNTRATMIELFDGLEATSQNCWPSLAFDIRALHQRFSALMPSGFYYKTFMWPPKAWLSYERAIRKAAGLGDAPRAADPDRYAFEYVHCDVLVVGAGPSGLAAALAAAQAGDRVVIADERAEFGGSALWEKRSIAGIDPIDWVSASVAQLRAMPNVRCLPRSTAFGMYDHGLVALAERVTDHLAEVPSHTPRQRLIHLRAQRIVLATGAIERPLVFADNDKPGVMLASAIRAYIGQHAVLPGRLVVVFTNNDDAYRTAFAAKEGGAESVTVVDTRRVPDAALAGRVRDAGIACHSDACIAAVHGRDVAAVTIVRNDGARVARVDCDVIGTSGGWSPTVHLYSQAGGKLRFDERIAGFVPGATRAQIVAVGGANGDFTAADRDESAAIDAYWQAPRQLAHGKRFVDIQGDVTVEDIELAHRENFRSVEHLKRYTTLGMGTDQGKTSNLNGLAIMALLRNESIPAVGTTTFRPPYTPVAFGLFAGAEAGKHATPVRRTALHGWHVAHGALLTEVGHWLRPRVYQQSGETFDAAWRRESLAVRNAVGIVDVGTLGKIDVQGPDALEFLQRVYCNNLANLKTGRLRYALMLREDGIVFDDGTVARLADDRFIVSTTTVNAAKVQSHFEFLLQVVWPGLRCHAVSVTEQYAQFALAGPRSRDVLAALLPHCDVSDAGLPHLALLQTSLDGAELIVYRMSYSGERAYEIAVGADFGESLWTQILECGKPAGIMTYGTEAMGVLRIEKGHVTGNELDGRTTAADVGLGRLMRSGGGHIGAALAGRDALTDLARPTLVGLVPVDGRSAIRTGSHLVASEVDARSGGFVAKPGVVTSATPSAFLGHPIALALLENGGRRHGEELIAASPLSNEFVRVRVGPPVFVDPEHARMKG